jgi:ABC-2 type transport system ATP-binding protein
METTTEIATPTVEVPAGGPPEAAPAGPAPLVRVRGLVKHYGPIKAVDGISFEVRRGDVLGFLGPNGAGKTTAMRLITGFLEPDSGEVEVAGHDLAKDSLAARQRMGYLPENAPAYGEMTVAGFLAFVAEARAVENAQAAIQRVLDLAELRAADKCIVLSTHILEEVELVCNRVLIISEGRILVDSTPRELIARAPNHNVVRLTLKEEAPELVTELEARDWCEKVALSRDAVGSVLEIYPRDGANRLPEILALVGARPIEAVQLQEGRLDELFRDLTHGVSR